MGLRPEIWKYVGVISASCCFGVLAVNVAQSVRVDTAHGKENVFKMLM